MTILVLNGCHVVTMNAGRDEHRRGYLAIDGNRITGAGPLPVPDSLAGARQLDASGCLATPGLINTHHHLYQWATRGRAVDSTLFDWLTELYPVWAGIDEQIVCAAATAALREGASDIHIEPFETRSVVRQGLTVAARPAAGGGAKFTDKSPSTPAFRGMLDIPKEHVGGA